MRDFLQNALWWVLAVAAACAIGLGIEGWRRRDLRKFAQEVGGTFEAGGILASVDIPEAAGFPGGSYNNVTRAATPDATIVVATHYRSWSDHHGRQKSTSSVVAYIALPGRLWPSIQVSSKVPTLIERPGPSPIVLPSPAPEFAAEREVFPVAGEPAPSAEAVARLLTPEVQKELAAHPALIAGLQAHKGVLRLQAVGQLTGDPHRDVYAVARKIASLLAK